VTLKKLKPKLRDSIKNPRNDSSYTWTNKINVRTKRHRYHVLRLRKRQKSGTIGRGYESEGNLQTSPPNLLRTFKGFVQKKYSTIMVDDGYLNLCCDTVQTSTPRSNRSPRYAHHHVGATFSCKARKKFESARI